MDARDASDGEHARPGAAPARGAAGARAGLLVDRELHALLGDALRAGPEGRAPTREQVQPASVDLRLGAAAWRVRAGFLPGLRSVAERLELFAEERLSLEGEGAVLERGRCYLVPLEEELRLPPDVRARFNPRSSAGRCDLFTRVLCEGHARFDEAPAGFAGRLWLEVAPLSFRTRLARGDRLCQVRLARERARLAPEELERRYAQEPLCYVREGALERALEPRELRFDGEGGLLLTLSLDGRSPVGWRSRTESGVLSFASEGAHSPREFFEPVQAERGGVVLEPGRFYVFASRERLAIPPDLAAEMQPVDVGIGELRNNYAGFFDSGFGWRRGQPGGTPAVLEVRAHDVPFLVEDGQPFFRLTFFRTAGLPERLYGEGRSSSYAGQDLTLARCFRAS